MPLPRLYIGRTACVQTRSSRTNTLLLFCHARTCAASWHAATLTRNSLAEQKDLCLHADPGRILGASSQGGDPGEVESCCGITRGRVRDTQGDLEWSPVRDVKGSEKGFNKTSSRKDVGDIIPNSPLITLRPLHSPAHVLALSCAPRPASPHSSCSDPVSPCAHPPRPCLGPVPVWWDTGGKALRGGGARAVLRCSLHQPEVVTPWWEGWLGSPWAMGGQRKAPGPLGETSPPGSVPAKLRCPQPSEILRHLHNADTFILEMQASVLGLKESFLAAQSLHLRVQIVIFKVQNLIFRVQSLI